MRCIQDLCVALGGHLPLTGRFWRRAARAGGAHRNTGGFQVRAGGLAADPESFFDAAQGPAELSQRHHLLSFLFAQDVCHPGGESCLARPVKRLATATPTGRFSGVVHWPVLGVHQGRRVPRRNREVVVQRLNCAAARVPQPPPSLTVPAQQTVPSETPPEPARSPPLRTYQALGSCRLPAGRCRPCRSTRRPRKTLTGTARGSCTEHH